MENEKDTNVFRQLIFILKPYWKGDRKREAWRLLSIVLVFLVLLAANNAFKTYMPKWAIDALTEKNSARFYKILLLGALMLTLSVPVETLVMYFIDKLGVCWRRWFNLNLLARYFRNKAYYNINLYGNVDNPDQRLAEDLNDFTQTSVTLLLTIGTSVFTFITFTGVLWTISPWLVLALILYASVGNIVIILFMRGLIKVNFLNIRYQADYRYNLVHVRDNLESIAFYKGERHEGSVLKNSFHTLIENYFRLIRVKRNIMFASRAYVLYGPLFPFIILAPAVLSGKEQIGELVQATSVFAVALTDLSIIIEQFPNLSAYSAKIQRLAKFTRAMDVEPPEFAPLFKYRRNGEFAFKNVSVKTPDLKRTLVEKLDMTVRQGERVIIKGPSGCGKSSLLRALAGLWSVGEGEITTPDMNKVMFLPQRPYMLVGSLRDQLVYPNLDSEVEEAELNRMLAKLNLSDLSERVGGFDTVLKWADVLSLGEQQRIMFVRLLLNDPQYAILDESTSALDEENESIVYGRLMKSNITYLSVGHRSSLLKFHDRVLQLDLNHGWQVLPVSGGQTEIS